MIDIKAKTTDELIKWLKLELPKLTKSTNNTTIISYRSSGTGTITGSSNHSKVVTQTISSTGTITIGFSAIGTSAYEIVGQTIVDETNDAIQTPIVVSTSKTETSFQIKAIITGVFSCVLYW